MSLGARSFCHDRVDSHTKMRIFITDHLFTFFRQVKKLYVNPH